MAANKAEGTVVELFAGVGGFRLGLDESGWKTIFSNQWEPGAKHQWAFDCYASHFQEGENLNVDIATVDAAAIPDHELLCGGFPCQDYSVASTLANLKGIQGKKGVLWWEIYRIAMEKRPRFMLLENVDRLLKSPAKQRGRDFGIILSCLQGLGYSVEWRIINAADYGFPQRRRRTFIFATNDSRAIKSLYGGKDAEEVLLSSGFFAPAFPCCRHQDAEVSSFSIPEDIKETSDSFQEEFENSGYCIGYSCHTLRYDAQYSGPYTALGDILEKDVPDSYCIPEGEKARWEYMKGAKDEERVAANGHEYHYKEGPIAFPDFLDRPSRTMLTSEGKRNRSTHVVRDPQTGKLRLLTPVECERLDGFPDGWTDTGMPLSFRYFCMGNALVVGLIAILGRRIVELKEAIGGKHGTKKAQPACGVSMASAHKREADAEIAFEKRLIISEVDNRIFGSFIEHLGRAVYTGIFQEGHRESDEEGFRKDVLSLVRELDVPIIRYPGGNYVSNFVWEDSVGPLEGRKKRLDLAWRSLEPNRIGLDEFCSWARKAGSEVMMAVNLGTRGIADACNLLEYCNVDADSYYASMRRANGHRDSYGIRLWCLGNEMDGPWQMGHKSAYEYGRLAAETAKAMKAVDPSIEVVSCGSSNEGMPTYPEWERISLMEDYEYVDYISMHQYIRGEYLDDMPSFLANSLRMDSFIRTVEAACDYVKAVKRSPKRMMISFDEWNVWYHKEAADDEAMASSPWQVAPHLLEDVYTFADALVVGTLLITLLRHSDRVRVACLAQLVNVIAPIMTAEDGGAWRQTIFFPYRDVSVFAKDSTVLQPIIRSPRYSCRYFQDVDSIESVAVLSEEEDIVTVFAVNRDTARTMSTAIDLRSFTDHAEVIYASTMAGFPLDAVNTEGHEAVRPCEMGIAEAEGGIVTAELPSASWNVIRVRVR